MDAAVPVNAVPDSPAKIRNVFTPVPSLAKPEALNVASFVAKFAELARKMNDVKTAGVSAPLFAVPEAASNPTAAAEFVSARIVETACLTLANCATEIVPKPAMTIMPALPIVSLVMLQIAILNAVTQPS